MICLGCQQEIIYNVGICPHCNARLNPEKLRFIEYLGNADNLIGYQKSYKLVLLKTIFEFLYLKKQLSVDSIMYQIKEFYLERRYASLPSDYNVDSIIKNISEKTSIYEIWSVFKANPYNAINNQGFLFLEKNDQGELVFVLPEDVVDTLTIIECKNVINILNKKLVLYYSKYERLTELENFSQIQVDKCLIEPSHSSNIEKDDKCSPNNQNSDSKIIKLPIGNTSLGTRARNSLMKAGYRTVEDILWLTEPNLNSLPSVGKDTVVEILKYIGAVKQQLSEEAFNGGYEGYGLIKFPYINIHSECENIPVIVLSCFGVPPSLLRKLQEQGIYKLGQLKNMDYSQIEISLGNQLNKLMHFELNEFKEGIISTTKLLLDNLSNKKDLNFIVERAQGATLQELGDKNNMTREGVRVKIEKPLKFIKPVAVCLATALIKQSRTKFLTSEDIYNIYDNDSYNSIIDYALKESEDIETIDVLGFFFLKEKISYNKILCEVIQEYVGEGVLWKQNIEYLTSMLQNKNLSFLELDDVWLYMLSIGYKVYGNYVTPRFTSYGTLLAIIIDEEFPTGISFGDLKSVKLLREKAAERFGHLHLPENDKALVSRVIDQLVLCDNGKWIAPNRIIIDFHTIEIIKEYIDQSNENIIFYHSLFDKFKGLLTMTSDVANYHYLHGILKFYFGTEYVFTKNCLRKEKNNMAVSLDKRIHDFIANKGRAVSKKDLKEYLGITSDIVIKNAVNASQSVFPWEFGYYNCLSNIMITSTEIKNLLKIIDELFDNNQNYCSAKMIYDCCKQLMPEIIHRNKIDNHNSLFYVAAILFKDKYKFRNPHVLPLNEVLTTTEDIAKKITKDLSKLDLEKLIAMTEQYGWGQSTIRFAFNNIVKNDYYQISRNEYLRKEELCITKEQVEQITEILDTCLTAKQFIGIWEIDYAELPEIGYEWTSQLLGSVITSFIKKYRLVAPGFGKYMERGLCVLSESGLKSFDEIVVNVMRLNGRNILTENEMYTLLVLSGVIKNSIPHEIRESKLLTYDNGIYSIKENI